MGFPVSSASDEPPDGPVAAEIVAGIKNGDKGAETKLYQRYARRVRLVLRRAVGDPETAADMHQETFLIVIERLRGAGVKQPEKLCAFIYGIARNLVRAYKRVQVGHRTHPDTEKVEAASSDSGDPVAELEREENVRFVREVIDELPVPRDREILLRFYVLDQDRAVIRAAVGLDAAHFNRVLFRAKERFKELLKKHRRRQQLKLVERDDEENDDDKSDNDKSDNDKSDDE